MEKINYYYFESFDRCICREKIGDAYQLECKAKQRGEKTYAYRKGTDRLEYGWNGKRFDLSREALGTVLGCVEDFDRQLEEAIATYAKIDLSEVGLTLYYRHTDDGLLDILWKSETNEGKRYRLKEWILLSEVIRDIRFTQLGTGSEYRDKVDRLFASTKDTIGENPLYLSALERGDTLLRDQLLLHYRIADEGTCLRIVESLGTRILPSLPKEYDKEYYVTARTIDYELLARSGYCLLHRPYFAMKGSTHGICTLNPHTKTGVDAAKIGVEEITFDEYLKFFDRR